jgi:nitroreductase
MDTRRSARIFSPEPIPLEAVRPCIDFVALSHTPSPMGFLAEALQ